MPRETNYQSPRESTFGDGEAIPSHDETTSPELIREVQNTSLSAYMEKVRVRYNELAVQLFKEPRKDFIWQWLKLGVEKTILSCVDAEHRETVSEAIQKSIVVDVLIDDMVDQLQDENFLDTALAVVKDNPNKQEIVQQFLDQESDETKRAAKEEYLELLEGVWADLHQELAKLPRYQDFQANLEADYKQLWTTFYAALDLKDLTKHRNLSFIDLQEVEKTLSYNMHIMIGDMIMLMGSTDFDEQELENSREFFLLDQLSGNFENDWYTFPIELKQGDIASALVLHAIKERIISYEEIEEIMAHPYNGEDRLRKAEQKIRDGCADYVRRKRLDLIVKRAEIGKNITSFDVQKAIENSFVHKNMHEQLGSAINLLK